MPPGLPPQQPPPLQQRPPMRNPVDQGLSLVSGLVIGFFVFKLIMAVGGILIFLWFMSSFGW